MPPFKSLELSKTGLKKAVVDKINNCILSFPEIHQVIIYGSRAKGNFRNGSDIDICLIGDNLDSNVILKLDNKLDDLLLPYTFDISIYDKLDNPNFKDHIDRVGMIFFERQI